MGIKISLTESELRDVLTEHVKNSYGFPLDGKSIDIKFTAGRKGAGTTVDIDISNANQVLGTATVAESAKMRQAVIESTGTDALGHAATLPHGTDPNTGSNGNPVAEETAIGIAEESVDDVELPPVTPETPVPTSGSIFDQ